MQFGQKYTISQFMENFDDALRQMVREQPKMLDVRMLFAKSTKAKCEGYSFLNPLEFKLVVPPRQVDIGDEFALVRTQEGKHYLLFQKSGDDFALSAQISAENLRRLLNQAGIYGVQCPPFEGIIWAAMTMCAHCLPNEFSLRFRGSDIRLIQPAAEETILNCLLPQLVEKAEKPVTFGQQLGKIYIRHGDPSAVSETYSQEGSLLHQLHQRYRP